MRKDTLSFRIVYEACGDKRPSWPCAEAFRHFDVHIGTHEAIALAALGRTRWIRDTYVQI